jgi:nucleotide-binding universal stress UspA family protein
MRILIATGGSEHSKVAVQMGAALAETVPLEVTILTVIKRAGQQAEAQRIVAEAGQILGTAVPNVHTKISPGHPAEIILRELRDGRYDLVILGEREHHTFIAHIFNATTGDRVIHQAYCPVLIAKKEARPVHSLLLCDSGLPGPSLLDRLQQQLPELLQSDPEVTILHVMSQISAGPGVAGKQLRANADVLIQEHSPEGNLLARDLQQLSQEGVSARPKIRHGLVVDEILDESVCGDYDLIVIGAHQGKGWQRFLLEDLMERIVLGSDRPVLIVQ